jgi:hypothetical protein
LFTDIPIEFKLFTIKNGALWANVKATKKH